MVVDEITQKKVGRLKEENLSLQEWYMEKLAFKTYIKG